MTKERNKSMKTLVCFRRASQFLFFFLFVYILWSTTYPLKGGIAPSVIFKCDPLSVFFTSLSERVLLPGIGVCLGLLAATLVLGRFFCGWVCPLGTFNDWAGAFRSKDRQVKGKTNEKIRKIKFYALILIALAALAGLQIAWVLDPLVIIARFVSLNLIPSVTWSADKFFAWSIQSFNLHDSWFYDLYRELKNSLLGVSIHTYSNSALILLFFVLIVAAGLYLSRAWCRALCPLGGIYALFSKPALLERKVTDCSGCLLCQKKCRMDAILTDQSYAKGECILCMDCVYDCPKRGTTFAWRRPRVKEEKVQVKASGNISRGNFLFLMASSLFFVGAKNVGAASKLIEPNNRINGVIRPPGALQESAFVDRCIRCGNCMKVCVTNGLQPVMMESGIEGIWTPRLVPEIGYCEYNCSLCGQVCPTGAIANLPLALKQKTVMGKVQIDKTLCLPWAEGKECLVCEEHCPVPDKAIKTVEEIVNGRKLLKPVVMHKACIGCSICQNVCPVRPVRAIRVNPAKKPLLGG